METVVVTASAGTFPGLVDALKAIPVAVEERSLLDFTSPADWKPLDVALDRFAKYGAVAFTSPRAARAVVERIEFRGRRPERGTTATVWAGGPATAAALADKLDPVRTPRVDEAARLGAAGALARAMVDAGVLGPVLFPCGQLRREELPERLRSAGVEVEEVECYRSVLASEPEARMVAARGTVLVVTSPSVAVLLARACPPDARPDLLAVGPTTAAAARESGWLPTAVAAQPSAEALAAAVRALVMRRHSPA